VLRLDRLSVFVLPHGVITIRRHPGFDIQEVIERTENNADLLKHGAGALVHSLLDVIVDSHFDAVQALDDAWKNSRTASSTTRPAPSTCSAAPTSSVRTWCSCAGSPCRCGTS
jgi:hypothetical protein